MSATYLISIIDDERVNPGTTEPIPSRKRGGLSCWILTAERRLQTFAWIISASSQMVSDCANGEKMHRACLIMFCGPNSFQPKQKVPWQQPANRFLLVLPSHVTGPFPLQHSVCQPCLTVPAVRSYTGSDYTEQAATETHNPTHTRKKEKKGLLVTLGLTLEQTQTAWKHSTPSPKGLQTAALNACAVEQWGFFEVFLVVRSMAKASCFSSVCRLQTTFKYAHDWLMSLQCADAALAK